MKKWCIWLLLFKSVILAQNISVIYMGLVPGGAPEFEERFDVRIREQITAIGGMKLGDFNDTEYFKNKTGFDESPVISRSFIESLMLISNDKTVVVWGKITDSSIKSVRRWIIGAEAVGSLTLCLTMYSLSFGEYAYLGDVTCKASIPKPLALFRNVDKVTHITASDRATIIKELQKQAAEKSADILSDVVRSQLMKSGELVQEGVTGKKVPSVSDLFDIPTVEPPDVDKGVEKKEEQPEKKEKEEQPEKKKKEEQPEKKKKEEQPEKKEKEEQPEKIETEEKKEP